MRVRSHLNPFRAARSETFARPACRATRRDVELLESRQLLSTFTVTNLHDSGPGSLHHAIVRSNRSAGADIVHFDVSGSIRLALGSGATTLDVSRGDMVHVEGKARHGLMGQSQQANVSYYNADGVSMQPVTAWQGIRAGDTKGQFFITGSSNANGLLFVGSIEGQGRSYPVNYPGAAFTSVYGPDNLGGGRVNLVGSYKNADASTAPVAVNGFLYEGTTASLPGGYYRTIDYPGARFNYVHSTMGGLAVGNYDGPTASGQALGPGHAYVYSIAKDKFVANVAYPGSVSNTAYGIWHNGVTSYTICGGYSNDSVGNVEQGQPIGRAYLVDYNWATGRFTHWTTFDYPNGAVGRDYVTHFEGISGGAKGGYTLNADSVQVGADNPVQGSFVTVNRNPNGTLGRAVWVDLNYPGVSGVTSSNSVSGNHVVGLVISPSGNLSFQATISL